MMAVERVSFAMLVVLLAKVKAYGLVSTTVSEQAVGELLTLGVDEGACDGTEDADRDNDGSFEGI